MKEDEQKAAIAAASQAAAKKRASETRYGACIVLLLVCMQEYLFIYCKVITKCCGECSIEWKSIVIVEEHSNYTHSCVDLF